MGMDVSGKTNDAYFRRNVWGWHGIPDYIAEKYPALYRKVSYWHSNDGDGLGEEDSHLLARYIKADVEDGTAAAYVEARDARLAQLPRDACNICQGKGQRTHADNLRLFNGDKDAARKVEEHLPSGSQCNACHGEGSTPAWESHYRLEVQDLVEFAEFLEECDGFEIW